MKCTVLSLLVICLAWIEVSGQEWFISDVQFKWRGCKAQCYVKNAEYVYNGEDQAKIAAVAKTKSSSNVWVNAFKPVSYDNGQFNEGNECSMFLVDGAEYGVVGEDCQIELPCLCKSKNKCASKPIASFLQIKSQSEAKLWIPDEKTGFKIVDFPQPWKGYAFAVGRYEFGDFNGDGLTDALHFWQSGSSNIWTNAGNDSFSVVNDFIPIKGYDFLSGNYKVGDFTGDGRADLIHFVSKEKAYVWISNTNGNFTVSDYTPWNKYDFMNGPFFVGDYNGDGKADLIHIVDSSFTNIWTSKGDGTFQVIAYRPWHGYGMANARWIPGDYNGDGKSDMLHFVANYYSNNWLSTGKNVFSVVKIPLPWDGYVLQEGDVFTGDLNGDNKTDLIHFNTDKDRQVVNWVSQGNGSFTAIKTPLVRRTFSEMFAGDFNGDGRVDVAQIIGNGGILSSFSSGKGGFEEEIFFIPDKPDSVTGKFHLGNFHRKPCTL